MNTCDTSEWSQFFVLIISIPDEELFSETAVGCTASYFVKIIWCFRWFCNPPPLFWGSVLLYLRSPKGGCCSISDDLPCSHKLLRVHLSILCLKSPLEQRDIPLPQWTSVEDETRALGLFGHREILIFSFFASFCNKRLGLASLTTVTRGRSTPEHAPWNRIVNFDTLKMTSKGERYASMSSEKHLKHNPTIKKYNDRGLLGVW